MPRRSLELLPIVTALADLRRSPDHTAELLSQIPHGHVVLASNRSRDRLWVEAIAPDGLHGWIRVWSLGETIEAARSMARPGLLVTAPWAMVELRNGERTRLPLGSRVTRAGTAPRGRTSIAIKLADGVSGEAASREVREEPSHAPSLFLARAGGLSQLRSSASEWEWVFSFVDPRDLLDTVRSLLHVPYLWGGTSPGGFDCSGLMRAAFLAHAVPLPRDAQDQATALRPFASATRSCRAGDLLFFGRADAVTHVAIAESARACLHAAGEVRRTRLDRPSVRDRALLRQWFLTVRPPYGNGGRIG